MASYYKRLILEARYKPWERSWMRLGRTDTKGQVGVPYRTVIDAKAAIQDLDPRRNHLGGAPHTRPEKPETPKVIKVNAKGTEAGRASRKHFADTLRQYRTDRRNFDTALSKYISLEKKFVAPLERLQRKRINREAAQGKIKGLPKPETRSKEELDAINTKTAAYNDRRAQREIEVEPIIDAERQKAQHITPSTAQTAAANDRVLTTARDQAAAKGPSLPKDPKPGPEPKRDKSGHIVSKQSAFVSTNPFQLLGNGTAVRRVDAHPTRRERRVFTSADRKAHREAENAAVRRSRERMAGVTSAPVSPNPLTGPVATQRDTEPHVVKYAKGRGWANMDTKVTERPRSVPGVSVKTEAPSLTGSGTTPGTYTVEVPFTPKGKKETDFVKTKKKVSRGFIRQSQRRAHELAGGEGPSHAKKVRAAMSSERQRAVPGLGSNAPEHVRARRLSKEERQARNTPKEEGITNFSIFLGQYLTEHRYD